MIRVVIVDDHAIVRSGLRQFLSDHVDLRVTGEAADGREALELVRSRPGITIPELAEAMGIQQNYLYRVMPGLAEEGKVTKSGRGWHLREGVA